MNVGRNDPCPCGSGAKYKKCCMDKNQLPSIADLAWYRQNQSRSALIPKIIEHAKSIFGIEAFDDAWFEFHSGEEELFDPESPELQIFMPWFFYHWTVDGFDNDAPKNIPRDTTPAHSLLQRRSAFLEPLQIEYIEACLKSVFSFFEVLSVRIGQGFVLKDVFTGEHLDVVEKMGSENIGIGDILFGKAVSLHGLTTMEATSTFVIPPIQKGPLLELRKQIEKNFKPITTETLREFDFELIDLYQDYRENLLNPKVPILNNTNGDPFVPQTVYFEIESPQVTFDALKELNFAETSDEILAEAVFDENKSLIKVEFPWLKKGNQQNKNWDNTVLGHLTIEGKSLKASVNSEKRAKLFRKLVKQLLGDAANYKTTVIESHESKIKAREINDFSEDPDDTIAEDPEVVERLTKMMNSHWDNWVNQKIPALGNKTPIQAAKTKDGKEMLVALLTQFERNIVDRPQIGVDLQTFKKIRVKLGI